MPASFLPGTEVYNCMGGEMEADLAFPFDCLLRQEELQSLNQFSVLDPKSPKVSEQFSLTLPFLLNLWNKQAKYIELM